MRDMRSDTKSARHEIDHLGLKEAFGTDLAPRTASPPIWNGARTSNSRADRNGFAPRSHCSSLEPISHLALEGTTVTVMHLGFPPLSAQFCTSQEASRDRHPERTTSRENGLIHTNYDAVLFPQGSSFILSHFPTSGVLILFSHLFW